jgi:formylglycine-generating enzyme required for sulfatase activity
MTITDLLPPPFEWCFIPAGAVRLMWPSYIQPHQAHKMYEVSLKSFYMAKYPITNAQYDVYVQETGRVPKLAYYDEQQQPLHPVVYLLWHEAMAFCDWLSQKVGFLITLPTDAQWQRAAQGDDDRLYPWGNNWDPSRCNTQDSRLHTTTPVTQYPQGASPYGVMDMVGNVCEWCLTNSKTGENALNYAFTDEQLWIEERIFQGSHFGTSRASTDVRRGGATLIFGHYVTGIRLVTEAARL